MPYDPALPATGAPLQSAILRGQLQSLKDLIDALPGVSAAQVDGVNTMPAGTSASVNVMLSGGTLHFTFDLPQGADGAQGPPGMDGQNGANGTDGATGPQGPQGPPFASAVVDGVNTVAAGNPASVSASFDGMNVHFTFDIPQGVDGPQGPAGPPGEVSQSDLQNAVTQMMGESSANTNAVAPLGQPADSGYNQAQMQLVIDKLNELIQALRR